MQPGLRSPLGAMDRWPATAPPRARPLQRAWPSRAPLACFLVAALGLALAVALGVRGSHGAAAPGRSFTRGQELTPAPGGARLPLAAQAEISGALAGAMPAYRAVAAGGEGFAAENPAQGLAGTFDSSGVDVSAGAVNLHLRLKALGFGAVSEHVAAPAPTARANRVAYARTQVEEWYANGPQGLEQGFTVPRPPAASSGPLTLTLELSGNGQPALSRDGRSLVVRHRASALSYGALAASDASGRALPSWLELEPGKLLLRVDAAGARFPLKIDPLVQKGPKLSGGGTEARFGTSTALSADGSTLLVGAPQANGSQGAAWIFQRSGSTWQQQGELTSPVSVAEPVVEECAEESAEEAGECAFGASVALSADGNTALVGEPSPGATAGSAWIFTRARPGSPWTREGEPLRGGGDPHEGRFGKSVALSADGRLALVGDPSEGNGHGAAWAFVDSGTWSRQAMLTCSDPAGLAHFGRSVALSGDGATAVIGGPSDAQGIGAAWAFTRADTIWAQRGEKLTGEGGGAEGHFGKSVALSADGATALVAAPDDGAGRGATWTFARSGSTFAKAGSELAGPAGTFGRFGAGLALSGDGGIALIGSPHAEGGRGLVGEFKRSGSGWGEQAGLGGSEAVGNGFAGASVALSSDGEVAAIGAPRDSARAGAAWVFSREPAGSVPGPAVASVTPGHGPTSGGTGVTISGSNLTTDPAAETPIVMFGPARAQSVLVQTGARIQAVAPPGAKGIAHVTVTTANGRSAETDADKFRYEGPAEGGSGTVAGGLFTAQTGSGGVAASTASAAAACRVTLRSRRLVVSRSHAAMIRLLRTGSGPCRGTVSLRYRQRTSSKHFKTRTIGSARFSIAAGHSQVVATKLNRLGRALFAAARGRLSARVVVSRTTPGPKRATTANVRLSVKKAPRPATVAR
jgi:hypothetical protein